MWIYLRRWDQLCKVSFVSKKEKLKTFLHSNLSSIHRVSVKLIHPLGQHSHTSTSLMPQRFQMVCTFFQLQTDTFCFSEMCVTKLKTSDDLSKTLTSCGRSTKTCFWVFFVVVHWVLNAQLFSSLHQRRPQWSCTWLCLAEKYSLADEYHVYDDLCCVYLHLLQLFTSSLLRWFILVVFPLRLSFLSSPAPCFLRLSFLRTSSRFFVCFTVTPTGSGRLMQAAAPPLGPRPFTWLVSSIPPHHGNVCSS